MAQMSSGGDIDEFIEYELTKGCNETDEIEFEQQGYIEEHVEMLEEYQDVVDIKPVVIEQIEEIKPEEDDDYILDDEDDDDSQGEQYIHDDEIAEFDEFTEYQALDLEEDKRHAKTITKGKAILSPTFGDSNNDTDCTLVKIKEEKDKPASEKNKNPPVKRYLLFDDLVATIVEYDADNTPIVEFALARPELDDKLAVECGICPEVMPKTRLPKHLTTHLVPGTNRYQCIYCDESYKDYKYLAGHARRHMGIRPYVCEICKLYFSTKQDMRVHNQRRHLEKEHICEICGKTFSQNTQLKRHRESTHEKKRRFQCEFCPKAYYKNFSLKEHVRNVHLGKRRLLNCPFCGMKCRDAHKMARHRKEMHLNQTNYTCEICNEEFTEIHYFDAHKRSIQCRNNTKRHLEEQGINPENEYEDDEVLVADDPQGGVQYVIQQDRELGPDEVVIYDEMGQIIIDQLPHTSDDHAVNVINQIVEQDEQSYLQQQELNVIPDDMEEHIPNDDDDEHIVENTNDHIIPDEESDFIYEVTLETQE